MITKIETDYSELLKSKNQFSMFVLKFDFIFFILSSSISYIFFISQDQTQDPVVNMFGTIVFGILGLMFSRGITGILLNKPISTNQFVYNKLKEKYQKCLYIDGDIVFKDQDTFYKVIKIQKEENSVTVISQKTVDYRVDSIS